MKTSKKSEPTSDITTKLKACGAEIQHYVRALEAENLKLQREIAKHQAHNVTLNNRIKLLEEEKVPLRVINTYVHIPQLPTEKDKLEK